MVLAAAQDDDATAGFGDTDVAVAGFANAGDGQVAGVAQANARGGAAVGGIEVAHRVGAIKRGPGSPSQALIDALEELTGLSGYPVLDAGCGFGRNALALASRDLSVVCVDRSADRLNSFIQ